jgi:hypothetical protein
MPNTIFLVFQFLFQIIIIYGIFFHQPTIATLGDSLDGVKNQLIQIDTHPFYDSDPVKFIGFLESIITLITLTVFVYGNWFEYLPGWYLVKYNGSKLFGANKKFQNGTNFKTPEEFLWKSQLIAFLINRHFKRTNLHSGFENTEGTFGWIKDGLVTATSFRKYMDKIVSGYLPDNSGDYLEIQNFWISEPLFLVDRSVIMFYTLGVLSISGMVFRENTYDSFFRELIQYTERSSCKDKSCFSIKETRSIIDRLSSVIANTADKASFITEANAIFGAIYQIDADKLDLLKKLFMSKAIPGGHQHAYN